MTGNTINPAEPNVTVLPIPLEEAAGEPVKIDLGEGGEAEEERISKLIEAMRSRADAAYLLSWQGSRVPSGARIGNYAIAWTQHGFVRSEEGYDIGVYHRIQDGAGPDRSNGQNTMLVFTLPGVSR